MLMGIRCTERRYISSTHNSTNQTEDQKREIWEIPLQRYVSCKISSYVRMIYGACTHISMTHDVFSNSVIFVMVLGKLAHQKIS